jgi:hypothetical protein
VQRDAFPAWTRRPVGLLLLALLLGACGAASAAPGFDPSSSSEAGGSVERLSATMRPSSYDWTAQAKAARATSGSATEASGTLRRLETVPVAGQKLTSVGLAPAAAAGAQAPASGAILKIATPTYSGEARVAGGASAAPAEPCT